MRGKSELALPLAADCPILPLFDRASKVFLLRVLEVDSRDCCQPGGRGSSSLGVSRQLEKVARPTEVISLANLTWQRLPGFIEPAGCCKGKGRDLSLRKPCYDFYFL